MADDSSVKGIDFLNEAYDAVDHLASLEESCSRAKSDLKKAQRELSQTEKARDDEIASTVKKRSAQIESAYDKEIDSLQNQIDRVGDKRQTRKEKQQDKRFRYETEDLRAEIKESTLEIKKTLKQHKIPEICSGNLYYRLFFPKGVKDYLTLFLWVLITFAVVPGAVCFAGNYTFLKDMKDRTVTYILIFIVCILLTVIVYLVIINRTKVRFREELLHCKNEKIKIQSIKKQMRAVRNRINKDRDESGYGLDEFDSRISDLKDEVNQISEQKKQALIDFDENKRPEIEAGIKNSYQEKIDQTRDRIRQIDEYQQKAALQIKDMRLAIADNYEPYLGRTYTNPERLADLITIMENGQADNLSDAIKFDKGRTN